MIPASLSPLVNHLWQSTLSAGLAGLLTLALRKNSARIRHWIWMAASIKFLIAFSLFVALGGLIGQRTTPTTIQPAMTVVVDGIGQTFTPVTSTTPESTPGAEHSWIPAILFGIWACGFIGISISWMNRWRRIRSAVRAGSHVELGFPIRAISSTSFLEPGVFGVFRPILLLPDGIFEHLTPEQWTNTTSHLENIGELFSFSS